MDTIYIRDLSVRCTIGVDEWERKDKQDILINITLFVDFSVPKQSDKIEDTINYRSISKRVLALAETSQFRLIEALADYLAKIIVDEFKVNKVILSIDKPGALRFSRSVAVEVTREKNESKA